MDTFSNPQNSGEPQVETVVTSETVSFDELSDEASGAQGAEADAIKADMDKKSESKEGFDEERGSKDEVERDSGKSEDSKEPDTKEKEDEKEDDQEVKKAGRPREIKAKVGEETVKYRPDAVIPVKVDGKNVDASLQDLMTSFSSEKHAESRLAESKSTLMESEKLNTALQSEKRIVGENMGSVMEKLKSSDPFGALKLLVDLSGESMYDIESAAIRHFTPVIEELQEMSEAEQEAYFLKRENEYLKTSSESKLKSQKDNEAKTSARMEVDNLREAYGVSEEEYFQANADLLDAGVAQEQIKPNMVLNHHVKVTAIDKSIGILKEVDSELAQNDAQIENLTKFLLTDHGLSRAEIIAELKAEHLDEDSDNDDFDALEDKITKKTPPNQPTKHVEESHVESFDDYY